MNQIIGRLRGASREEIRFRLGHGIALAAEAVRFVCGREDWRRDQLRSLLLPVSPDLVEARSAASSRDWPLAHAILRSHFTRRSPRFVLDPSTRIEVGTTIRGRFPRSAADAVRRANPLLEHRYDLLGYSGLSFRSATAEVDWHFDPVHARTPAVRFWSRVPYLDPGSGDHKIIWELNRHQHWLALGRAAWLTGDGRYAQAFDRELESWLRANPPLGGVNWASMLELALRSISWIWALHFFCAVDDQVESPTWLIDLLVGLDRQLDQVSRHLSLYFSPNTHLLGESLALYVAGRVLPELRSAERWEALGRRVLIREARAQVNPDGGHAELSLHYHRYALDFYLLALAVARRTGDPAEEQFTEVAERLAAFCRALADDSGRLPTIGDDDGGMLFPVCGRSPADASGSLAVAAALLGQPDLATGKPREEVLWMLGGRDSAARQRPVSPSQGSRIFPDSGYVVLRSAVSHAVLDAGPHGFLNGGHAHSDALSLVLSVDGQPLLIDPGTATYTADRSMRDRFRSTRMHNTVVIDGRPQSVPAGPFHWASRTDARLDFSRCGREFDYAEALHDGYRPLIHRRAVLRTAAGLWLVADHILGTGHHHIDAYWHVDPAWTRRGAVSQGVHLEHPGGLQAILASTAQSGWQEFYGDAEGLGWCAPVYGQVVPSLTFRASQDGETPISMVTAIRAATSPAPLTATRVHVAADGRDGWHRTAVAVTSRDTTDVAVFAAPLPCRADEVPGQRFLQAVAVEGGELVTDARAARLTMSEAGEPVSLLLIDGSAIMWTGRRSFDLTLGAAQDLHLEVSALRRLSRGARMRDRRDRRYVRDSRFRR